MKVIDLLNKIAKREEVPKKIKYKDIVYEWKRDYNRYYMGSISLGGCLCLDGILNDEVEIIEEPKKIEKLSTLRHSFSFTENEEALIKNDIDILNKINELINKVNEMSNGDNNE